MRENVGYVCKHRILSGPAAPPPLLPAVRRDPLQANYLDFLVKSPTTSSFSRSPSTCCARYTKCTPKLDELFTCPICYNNWSDITTISLECRHTFCHTCWNMFLVSKICDEGEHAVHCMAAPDPFVCDILIPTDASAPGIDAEQQKENVQIWARFQALLARNLMMYRKISSHDVKLVAICHQEKGIGVFRSGYSSSKPPGHNLTPSHDCCTAHLRDIIEGLELPSERLCSAF